MPPSAPTFYVDESIYSKLLVARLIAAGTHVERVGDAVPFGSHDDVWLAIVGQNGWVALMRDKRIRYRTLERRALILNRVGAFAFDGGQATAEATANRIVELLPKMSAIALSESRPFLFTFSLNGPISRVKLSR